MPHTSGVFAILPENFFSPLASPNRQHYAALLVLYFRLFQENARFLEREQVMRSYMDYLGRHRDSLVEDDDPVSPSDEGLDLCTDSAEPASGTPPHPGAEVPAGSDADTGPSDRVLASRFLRKLINAGWLGEETLQDYSRVINITPYARPFFEALARVEEGLKTEYESHVVAIYSLLCGDAVAENGHYTVLNAHSATIALIDSLKVLSQSIKGHYDRFTANAASDGISNILHLHYDLYANDILDGAYKRLKTSDNLSRYRPKIIKKVGELLSNEAWLNDSARKLARLSSIAVTEGRRRLETMLEEIRDTLRAVDPLLEDIDRRNMLYAKASIERVKTLLEPDSTIAGQLGILVGKIYKDRDFSSSHHRIHGIRTFAPESIYRRYKREAVQPKGTPVAVADKEAQMQAEAVYRLRLERQMSPAKIIAWLDEAGGRERLLSSQDLVQDEDSFVRFVYSVLYADSRPQNFAYHIDEPHHQDQDHAEDLPQGAARIRVPGDDAVESAGYVVPDLILRRKR
ncbi:MAG: DUF5716 family protein [Treponema sp.]|jgi:hypothetical protein|nr:DUF5716 family protein [Treponema sp.]